MNNNTIINELLSKAKKAQEEISDYTQEQIHDVCLSIAWQVYEDENISKLAKLAVEETGMGIVEDKIKKHKNKVLGVIKDVKNAKTVGLIEEDKEKGIYKYAKPVGVVGALTPVTNPTATPASNAVSILSGKNAVIFAPHPKSKKSTKLAVDYMRQGLTKIGAPQDLIQVIEEPSIELTGELMKKVDLILATGGGAMVKAAYSSGTPAYGVGPGNAVQIVAEDADVKDAVNKIVSSKCFDNATSCSSENSIIVHESIYDDVIKELKRKKGHICSTDEKKQLAQWMWQKNKKGYLALNPNIVAKSAVDIAKDANLDVPQNTLLIIVEGQTPIVEDLFAQEKLSPVLTIWKYSDFDQAMKVLVELTDNSGKGHSCGIHTFNNEYIRKLATSMKSSRIVVRQPQAAANGGAFFNGMPSTVTLGCGTWGGNITTENINYKHFLNITWLSLPIEVDKPSDDQIWGEFFERYEK